jgi:hypothetical protein
MIHVVVMKCLIGLLLLMHIELLWKSRSLKIEESESEVLCTDCTALLVPIQYEAKWNPERIWSFWRNEKSISRAGIRTQKRPVRRLVTIIVYPFQAFLLALKLGLFRGAVASCSCATCDDTIICEC